MSRAIRLVTIFLVVAAVAAYAAGAVLLWHFPDRFVHFPEPEVRQTPGMAGLGYVDVWLRAGPQREWVHGWFLPNERNAPVVLLLHGTGRTIAGMVHVAAAIHRAGAAVLMIDYRGLGKSTRGPLTEARMYEDAEAAWHELRWHQPDPALRLVYGHSLGGAIALELAARYPDVNGVVVEAAPTSIAALLRESWVARIYPVDVLLAGRFDAAAKIRRLGAPLLVVHGKRDPIVPAAMGVELYLRARGSKRLLLVDGAAHSDAAIVGAAEYQAAFERMLPPLREPALAGGPARPDGSAVLGQDSPGPRDRPERQAMQLEGIRVVDLTRIIAGPFCSMFLADMGVKVETPGEGDPVRAQGAARNGCSLYFATFNRNKRSITLDLRTDDGREVLRRLLARSDVVVNNYRPGVMDRMGFGREALRAIKPDIVSCNVTGFGLDGPYADRPSFDFIAQAMSGFMSVNGDPTGPGMRAAPPTSTASRRCATPLPRPSTRPRRTPRPAARSRAC